MKAFIKRLCLSLALASALVFVFANDADSQVFTLLHTFLPETYDFSYTNQSGGNPTGPLVLSSNVLYGAAYGGGTNGSGTVFKVNTDGTGYAVLYDFTSNSPATSWTNGDGAGPMGGLVISGNTLYGTATDGGAYGDGTVYAVNMDGSGFTNLHIFSGGDGIGPVNGLILSGNTFYGATDEGGAGGSGTVFAMKTDGSGFTNLHSFDSSSDGELLRGGLVLSSNTLYGVTYQGGAAGFGTIFAVNTDGTGFTNMHDFVGGSEGEWPIGPLTLSGNTLFGGTMNGGSFSNGTIFAINTDGSGFTTIHSCSFATGSYPASLMSANSVLYGIAAEGGPAGHGFVFEMNTDGTDFTPLHVFGDTEGEEAQAPLILSGNTFFGVAQQGGGGYIGTIFRLSFAPQLTITPTGTNIVLSWPTNVAGFDYTGFTLQSTAGLGASANWSAVSSAQGIVGGQCIVTNPVSGTQMFYRLAH